MNALLAFADLLEEPQAPPAWFCEPRDKEPRSEFERQRAFVNYMRRNAPSVMVVAVPNGSKGSDWEKIRKWQEGAITGMTDLAILWRSGVFLPEFKDGTSMPRKSQCDVICRLHAMGFRTGVYRQPATLIAHLRDAGAPFAWDRPFVWTAK